MYKKTILNNELAKNSQQIKHIYKTFWVLQSVALLLSSEEASLLIFIAVLPHYQKSEKMKKENGLIIKKFKTKGVNHEESRCCKQARGG